jgi:glycerophosphoryl diester phosphodiesterase
MMRFDKVRELRICGYEHVPTLGEALTVIGHRAHAFVELKAPLRDEKYRAQRVAWEIKNRDLISNSTIISFSMRDLEAIASCNDWLPEKYRFKINIGYLNLGRKDALLNAKSIGARKSLTLHPRIDERFIEQMHGNGIEVIAWTVDSAGEALRLARIGVDGIITNRPDRIKEALEKGKA